MKKDTEDKLVVEDIVKFLKETNKHLKNVDSKVKEHLTTLIDTESKSSEVITFKHLTHRNAKGRRILYTVYLGLIEHQKGNINWLTQSSLLLLKGNTGNTTKRVLKILDLINEEKPWRYIELDVDLSNPNYAGFEYKV